MKQSVSIFLVIVLSLNLFGFYFAFSVKRDEIRKEVAVSLKGANRENSKTLSFSKADFEAINWIEEGKEFRMNGKLYDVASVLHLADHVELRVEEDAGETNLLADFVSVLSKNAEKDESNSPLKLLLSHFLLEFTVEQPLVNYDVPASILAFNGETSVHFASFISGTLSPPPDLTC